jgi:hypothetical protein
MATYKDLADAIIQQEGAFNPRSVNMRLVTQHGLWNVGHLEWRSQRGAVPVDINGRLWAGWPSYEDSYDGLLRQLWLYVGRGLTLEQMIYKYAPPQENYTEKYIAFVSSRTGIPRDGRLADYLPEETYFQYAGRKADQTPTPDRPSPPAESAVPEQVSGWPLPLLTDAGDESAEPGVETAELGGSAGAFILLAAVGAAAAILLKRG